MTRKTLTLLLAALACAVIAAPARADVVTINNIDTAWVDPVGGANVVISNTAGLDSIRWGTGTTSAGPSGYDWLPVALPFNAPVDTPFALGTFTHLNRPITSGADAITSVNQDFTIGTFGIPTTLSAKFLYTHDETFNGEPCVYPSTVPCADKVTIGNAFFNEPFTYNGFNHFFSLRGFSTDGGVTIDDEFITQEGLDNSAQLYAVITHAPIGEVPEPTSLVLLGGGLLAAAARKRLKR